MRAPVVLQAVTVVLLAVILLQLIGQGQRAASVEQSVDAICRILQDLRPSTPGVLGLPRC